MTNCAVWKNYPNVVRHRRISNPIRLVTFVCAVLMVVATFASSAFVHAPNIDLEERLAMIEAMMDELYAEGLYRGNVLISTGEEIVFNKSYGIANFSWNQPNGPKTIFRTGSLIKVMTAMVVLQLVQEGKLKLNGKITDYLPYYRKDTGDIITVAQLLDHSSGLPSFTSDPDFMHEISRIKLSTRDFLLKYCQEDLRTPPGTQYYYSNTGYFILGAIIESVTGKTYGQNLEERLLEPLGMTDSGYAQNNLILENFAEGYLTEGCSNRVAPFAEMSVPFSAGAAYSTVLDLHKLNEGISANKVLNEKYTALMLAPHIMESPGFFSTYGWDRWSIKSVDTKEQVILHTKSGAINGYVNLILRSDDYFIAMLSNMEGAYAGPALEAIIQILYGAPPVTVKPQKSVATMMRETICSQGIEAAKAKYEQLRRDRPAQSFNVTTLSELGANFLGVGLSIDITMQDIDYAIALFQLNARYFPEEPTVYKDLALAYEKKASHLPKSLSYIPHPLAPNSGIKGLIAFV